MYLIQIMNHTTRYHCPAAVPDPGRGPHDIRASRDEILMEISLKTWFAGA